MGPNNTSKFGLWAERSALGSQEAVFNHKAATPPLVSFGLSEDDHFAAALRVGEAPTPLEIDSAMDDDLSFASDIMLGHYGALREWRWWYSSSSSELSSGLGLRAG